MKVIITAMYSEIEHYIKESKQIEEKPFLMYQNNENIVIISGVGKVNAASALTYALTKYPMTEIIVNIGFVGGYPPLKQKDVVMVKQATYHDFDLTFFGYKKGQVPKMPESFLTDKKLLENFDYKEVSLFTGDTFMTSKIVDESEIIADMEGAAFYHVAHLFNIPIIGVKVVSDVIGSEEQLDSYALFENTKQDFIDSILRNVLKEL